MGVGLWAALDDVAETEALDTAEELVSVLLNPPIGSTTIGEAVAEAGSLEEVTVPLVPEPLSGPTTIGEAVAEAGSLEPVPLGTAETSDPVGVAESELEVAVEVAPETDELPELAVGIAAAESVPLGAAESVALPVALAANTRLLPLGVAESVLALALALALEAEEPRTGLRVLN